MCLLGNLDVAASGPVAHPSAAARMQTAQVCVRALGGACAACECSLSSVAVCSSGARRSTWRTSLAPTSGAHRGR